jgi:predicted hotdog family 3-hydroxylacyl-ACP dehydratase
MQLDRAWIMSRIPHQGSMCLLDHVESWDEQRVLCIAASHRATDNPLRAHGRLAAACGIEYAAQAMAVHGALIAQQEHRPRAGFLASVRGVSLHVRRLDDIIGDLEVEARHFSSDGNHILYDFSISAARRMLLEGRAAVVLDAQGRGKLSGDTP